MQLQWGQTYAGPGHADPAKSRAEREAELRRLSETSDGMKVIHHYFMQYTSVLHVRFERIDLPMIETILEFEYPEG